MIPKDQAALDQASAYLRSCVLSLSIQEYVDVLEVINDMTNPNSDRYIVQHGPNMLLVMAAACAKLVEIRPLPEST